MHGVSLAVREAMLVQAYTRSGEVRKAVQVCNGIEMTERSRWNHHGKGPLAAEDWDVHVELKWREQLRQSSRERARSMLVR